MVVMLIAQPVGMSFFIPLVFPIAAPIMLLFMVLIKLVLSIVKLGGVGNIMCMFFTVPGDPLVYLLFKLKPNLAIVNQFSIFNFAALMLVYKTDVPMSKHTTPSNSLKVESKCPFAGRIIADKESVVLGFTWPSKATIFNINEDWEVISNGTSYGWIDRSGQVRKGMKGNPEATLTPGTIVGVVKNEGFYVDGSKVGDLVTW